MIITNPDSNVQWYIIEDDNITHINHMIVEDEGVMS